MEYRNEAAGIKITLLIILWGESIDEQRGTSFTFIQMIRSPLLSAVEIGSSTKLIGMRVVIIV